MTFLVLGVLAVLVVVGVVHYLRVSGAEAGAEMLREYKEAFPGRCGICGYDRFGRQQGFIRADDLTPHWCREKGRWVE